MVFIGMVLYAFIWFVNIYWLMEVINCIENVFSFPPPFDNVVVLIKNLLVWHPIISLFGWILWGYLNSLHRDVRTFEY